MVIVLLRHVYSRSLFSCSLSNAGITNIESRILERLTSLEELDLSKNKLSTLEVSNSITVSSLKVLDVSHNQLSCIDGLMSFPNLESLVLSDNLKLEVRVTYEIIMCSSRKYRYLPLPRVALKFYSPCVRKFQNALPPTHSEFQTPLPPSLLEFQRCFRPLQNFFINLLTPPEIFFFGLLKNRGVY